jgi:hypothetical protein
MRQFLPFVLPELSRPFGEAVSEAFERARRILARPQRDRFLAGIPPKSSVSQ